jgi:hypothetical protein
LVSDPPSLSLRKKQEHFLEGTLCYLGKPLLIKSLESPNIQRIASSRPSLRSVLISYYRRRLHLIVKPLTGPARLIAAQ